MFSNLTHNETNEMDEETTSLNCSRLKFFGSFFLTLFAFSLLIDVFILMRIALSSDLRTHGSLFLVTLISFNLFGLFADLLIQSLGNFNCE